MSTLNDHQETKILTQVKKVDAQHPDMTIIREAAEIIRTGGLVGFPTETVYGLGADALLPEGAKRIYAAKGRPSDNPLIVHIAEFEALDKITADIPPQAKALADALNNDKIAGACIDVFETEPPIAKTHPLVNAKHTILTPHVAFASKEAMVKRAIIVFDNVVKYLNGTPQNIM